MKISDVIFAAIMGFVLGSFLVGGCVSDYQKKQAVGAGHAEYYIDTNCNKAWRWKEIK